MIELLVGTDKVVIDNKNRVICGNAKPKEAIEFEFVELPGVSDLLNLVRIVIHKFGGKIQGDNPDYAWVQNSTSFNRDSRVTLIY